MIDHIHLEEGGYFCRIVKSTRSLALDGVRVQDSKADRPQLLHVPMWSQQEKALNTQTQAQENLWHHGMNKQPSCVLTLQESMQRGNQALPKLRVTVSCDTQGHFSPAQVVASQQPPLPSTHIVHTYQLVQNCFRRWVPDSSDGD